MSRVLLLGLGIVMMAGIVSCSDKEKIPAGVLSKVEMESVLWDMIQAERFTAAFKNDSTHNLKAENFKLYAQVFAVHDISKQDFIKSYKFYLSRPDIAKVMFDSLNTRSNRLREDMYKPKETVDSTKAKADSANAILKKDSAAMATPKKPDSVIKHVPAATVPTQIVPAQSIPIPKVPPQTLQSRPPHQPFRRADGRLPLKFKGGRLRDSLLKANIKP